LNDENHYVLLTVLKKWTFDLSMTRATSGWHSFETHVNRFALLILSAHQQLDLSILHGDGTNETRKQTVVQDRDSYVTGACGADIGVGGQIQATVAAV
jgi:hypothetical protein